MFINWNMLLYYGGNNEYWGGRYRRKEDFKFNIVEKEQQKKG